MTGERWLARAPACPSRAPRAPLPAARARLMCILGAGSRQEAVWPALRTLLDHPMCSQRDSPPVSSPSRALVHRQPAKCTSRDHRRDERRHANVTRGGRAPSVRPCSPHVHPGRWTASSPVHDLIRPLGRRAGEAFGSWLTTRCEARPTWPPVSGGSRALVHRQPAKCTPRDHRRDERRHANSRVIATSHQISPGCVGGGAPVVSASTHPIEEPGNRAANTSG